MLQEIIEVYNKQYDEYCKVYDILKVFDREKIDVLQYGVELENIDFLLESISKINEKAEQLKQIYITKYNLPDFKGEYIKTVEGEAAYNELKEVVDTLGRKIIEVKKLHDVIISKINSELNTARQMLSKINISKNDVEKLLNPQKINESKYINKKK